jgi:hypothetical protein
METPTMDSRRRLIWHGMFLFLLGLLTGFMETKFTNPRMGLAAHLEGVMNGTFLIALGAVWMKVRLSLKLKATRRHGELASGVSIASELQQQTGCAPA